MARESSKARRERALRIVRGLRRAYPDAHCALHFESPFQLLVATILSAQCTDAMVNRVSAELFSKYGTPEALAGADLGEIEGLVKRTGFFRQKALSIQSAAHDIVERFGGEVPGTMEQLLTLRGVARKTANVVLGNAFGVPGLTVDTHMKRVSRRLGLTQHEDPVKIERDLAELVPRREWTDFSHRVIHHGRVCCGARAPRCETCPVREECPFPASSSGRRAPPRPTGRGAGPTPRGLAAGARRR